MTKNTVVPVDKLMQEPYQTLLCFPNPNEKELQERIQELVGLGVEALEFSGAASVFGVKVPVLGKGFVGIVVVAHLNEQRVAVKILRQDSGRTDLLHEARMLAVANSAGVAPTLIAASKNFILMQLIEGSLLPNWLQTNKNPAEIKHALSEVLEQCFRLDQIGLDHGELSKAPKHLLVDKEKKVFIVDFETASVERRVANVTAVCQYLFAGNSSASKCLSEIFGEKEEAVLREALRKYKKNKNRESFETLLRICLQ